MRPRRQRYRGVLPCRSSGSCPPPACHTSRPPRCSSWVVMVVAAAVAGVDAGPGSASSRSSRSDRVECPDSPRRSAAPQARRHYCVGQTGQSSLSRSPARSPECRRGPCRRMSTRTRCRCDCASPWSGRRCHCPIAPTDSCSAPAHCLRVRSATAPASAADAAGRTHVERRGRVHVLTEHVSVCAAVSF